MIEILRWAILITGVMIAAGCGAFIASALVLASRADEEQERLAARSHAGSR